jgi:hypothetical protein
MARFSGNPVKNPLTGNELIPATDPSTNGDICMTPIEITQFVQANMGLAAGSTQGAISGPMADKLAGLMTQLQLVENLETLAEVAIPIFISSPTSGAINIYQHVLDTPWKLSFAYGKVSAGSTNVTITKNNVNIAGFTNGGVTTAGETFEGTDSFQNMTFNEGDTLGITLAGSTGNAANLMFSIRADAILNP